MENVASPPRLDLSKYIETRFFGERPHIRGRRVPVAVVVHNALDNHWNISELAYNFGLTQAEVLAALLYYEEHKALIEQQEEAEQAELDRLHRSHGQDHVLP